MSYDLAVWYPHEKVTREEAGLIYIDLCTEKPCGLKAHPSIEMFYQDLTTRHPEIDNVPEEKLDDLDYSPWSCEFDRSDCFILMSAVWSKAEYVADLVYRLADKHHLAVYNPQEDQITYPDPP